MDIITKINFPGYWREKGRVGDGVGGREGVRWRGRERGRKRERERERERGTVYQQETN